MEFNLNKLISLRKELHKNPEVAGNEFFTVQRINNYIIRFKPDEVIAGLGGNGIAFLYKGVKKGPTVMFRCELDALPIAEMNQFSHRSVRNGVSHTCGHDGHMAIIAGMAEVLSKSPPPAGCVILLFQPEEETGQGARKLLDDPQFNRLKPDYVFALHNLPGFPMHSVIVKDGIFSSASIGLIVELKGKTSHASEPENGISPAFAMAAILNKFKKHAMPGQNPGRVKIITPVHLELGEKAFGTSPGYGKMLFTLRATHAKDFEMLKNSVIQTIEQVAHENKLHLQHEWVEEFPNTKNDTFSNVIVRKAAEQAGFSAETIAFPFRWSEDFGHFLNKYPGALFGLGSGINQPALHNPDYDFPDELIETGIRIFSNIYKTILK